MSAQTRGGRLSNDDVAKWTAATDLRGAAGRHLCALAREVQASRTMVERLKALHVQHIWRDDLGDEPPVCTDCGGDWPCDTRAIIDAIAEPTDAAPQQKETP